jgi:hypothetical protein
VLFDSFYSHTSRGELGSKSLRVKRFYKGHRYITEKISHHFKKASIPLKMYLKSLAILEKASISLIKSSKIIQIFITVLYFYTEASISLEMTS